MLTVSVAICAAVAAGIAAFISCPVHPEAITTPFGDYSSAFDPKEVRGPHYLRQTVHFDSKGTKCHAWLYTPTKHDSSRIPVVIMGHGLGAQKDMGLQAYAEKFVSMGLAALLIDYRNFGGSEGTPRNLINPFRHVEDWRSAIQFVTSGGLSSIAPNVDSSRLGLWGSSMAGGHVLVAAAAEAEAAAAAGGGTGPVRAVVSQIPHLNGRDSTKRNIKKRGLGAVLRTAALSLQDNIRGALGLSPFHIRIMGHEGELALMPSSDDEYKAYFAKHPDQKLGNWQNQAPARFCVQLPRYNPEDHLDKVAAQVLLVAATDDRLCPYEYVERARARLGARAEVLALEGVGHFAMYSGPALERAAAAEAAFLRAHLLPTSPAPGPGAGAGAGGGEGGLV